MNLKRLHEILTETTHCYRKGEAVETRRVGPLEVTEIFDMPALAEAAPEHVIIDVALMAVGADKAAAEARKGELIDILKSLPDRERLAAGPSYIETGVWIDSQDAALRLYALGEVLGLWKVITPATLGVSGPEALQLARNGFVMITGFR